MKAHLSPPLAPLRPGGYDFARDLYFQQIGASGYALGKLTISHPSASIGWRLRIARGIDEMRESINQRIRQVLPGDRGSIASALITGKRGALSAPVSDAFYISSLAHVLAISGYHVVVSAQERSLERTSFESPQLFEFRYVENGSWEVTTSHGMASQALPTAAYRACFPASQHRRETTESIEQLALPTGKSDQIWFDDSLPGFGIRLRAGGKRAWLIQYRIAGRQRRVTIGDARKLRLKAARAEAEKRFAEITLGRDPQPEREQVRAKAALVLGPLVDQYLALKKDRVRKNTRGILSIRGSRTKNHHALKLTLAAPALGIIQGISPKPNRDYVFGTSGEHFSRWGWEKLHLDKRIAEAGDLAGVYNRASYDGEIKRALAPWAEHLMATVEARAPRIVRLRGVG